MLEASEFCGLVASRPTKAVFSGGETRTRFRDDDIRHFNMISKK